MRERQNANVHFAQFIAGFIFSSTSISGLRWQGLMALGKPIETKQENSPGEFSLVLINLFNNFYTTWWF